VFNRPEEAWGK
jgi:hypothetical protein